MHPTLQLLFPYANSALSAEKKTALRRDYEKTDHFMVLLLAVQAVISATLTASMYGTWTMGIAGGLLFAGTGWLVVKLAPGTVFSRSMIGALFMLFSALYIEQAQGRIEFHFHVFVSMAVLIRYKDITPTLVAAGVIAAHHLLFMVFQQNGTMLWGEPLIAFANGCDIGVVMIHALFVVAEAVVNSAIIAQITRQFLSGMDVSAIVSQLNELVLVTRNSTSQLTDSSHELADTINNQHGELEGALSAIDGLVAQVNQSETISLEARATAAAARGNTQQLEEAMQEINRASGNISQIVRTIDEIAFQTNLLALNAAVEAARAGNAGAGFAVVAEEVRRLAIRSAAAAKDVSARIHENEEKARLGQSIALQIKESFVHIDDNIQQIADATGRANSEISVIADSMGRIKEVSRKTAATLELNTSAVEDLNDETRDLEGLIDALNENVTK
jgi:methyl-accepting chemotaxis protein